MTAVPSKVEAVQKVGEAVSDKKPLNSVGELERVAPNKENFQKFLNVSQPLQVPPKNPVPENKPFVPETTDKYENNPIFAEENVSTQKDSSATDKDGRRRQGGKGDDEVEGVEATGSKKKPVSHASLMDEVTKLNTQVSKIGRMNPEQLKTQANEVIAQIDQVKTQLAQTTTEIKPSYQTLLRNRLTHIDDNLKIALSKAGVEYTPPSKAPGANSSNPLERFIGFLTNSQKQLEGLGQTIDTLGMEKGQLTPANMLAIQMKIGYVQQQIELFTSLLNKALESTKSIMNVQV